MAGALFSGLSGLQAHQSWIDLIGNNLANASTPGYKSSQATFADHFSRTLQAATGPGANRGGRNPLQVGLGVHLADTARNFAQGALTNTGRAFDVALQGRGFFALSNGASSVYSRVGTFGLDASSFVVDQRTGYRVLNPLGQSIQLDTTSLLPPQATTTGTVTGNLPKVVTGPLAEVLTAASGFTHGESATLTSSNAGPYTIPPGETWTMQISVNGGAPQTVSVTSVTGTVTAADVATAIDALDGVAASVNGGGGVDVATEGTGEDVSLIVQPGAVNRDLAALAGFTTTLVRGSETTITAATTLNDLPANAVDYADGDLIHVSGFDADGTPIQAAFQYGAANDGTTVDDLVAYLDALYTGATVSLDAAGRIVVESDTAGESGLALALSDDAAAAGETQWATHALGVTTEGTAPDTLSTSMEVFDSGGVAHTLTLAFERQADGSWTVTPTLPPGDGTVLSAPITGLRFADDGSPIATAQLASTVSLSLTGQSAVQDVALDFGQDGVFTGLTQFGAEGDVVVDDQDGYGTGSLADIAVGADGSIEGLYTNGQSRALGALGIATFVNPEGLTHICDNFYAASLNSGTVNLGTGATGGAGQVVGGTLEGSNVDTAEQFVHLIEAQRGFQANARVISAQNEVLQETVNLV